MPKYRDLEVEKSNEVGAAVGLAWTEVGGQLLNIEATLMDGKGKLTSTGQLGDVMQESAQARHELCAFSLSDFWSPEGFLPAPGCSYSHPGRSYSQGWTFGRHYLDGDTGECVDAYPCARLCGMTGEITLRGKVLPIGGMKEKLLAAHRHAIHEVILPKDNEKDVPDIPENIRADMKLHFVEQMDEVLMVALERPIDGFKCSLGPAGGCRIYAPECKDGPQGHALTQQGCGFGLHPTPTAQWGRRFRP